MAGVHRLLSIALGVSLLFVASCGGDGDTSADPTVTTTVATDGTTGSSGVSTTTVNLPTTSLPCATIPIPTAAVKSPVPGGDAYLTKVARQGDACRDHVVFDFAPKSTKAPGYEVSYGTGPFEADGSGAVVPVAGNAFVVVKVQPGYTFDFETSKKTYTGPNRITPPGANHVTEIVKVSDFEGALIWVIGLDVKRPFTVQATGTPTPQLVVTIA
jgi:hypothetical protein